MVQNQLKVKKKVSIGFYREIAAERHISLERREKIIDDLRLRSRCEQDLNLCKNWFMLC